MLTGAGVDHGVADVVSVVDVGVRLGKVKLGAAGVAVDGAPHAEVLGVTAHARRDGVLRQREATG